MDLDTQNLVSAIHEQKDPLQKTTNPPVFKDLDMSLKAKGMLSYVFEQPEGWQVSLTDLMNFLYVGRTSVKSVIDELIGKSYGIRLHFFSQGSGGKFCGSKTQYVFFSCPKKISELYAACEGIIESYENDGYKFKKAVTYLDIEEKIKKAQKKKKQKSVKKNSGSSSKSHREKVGETEEIENLKVGEKNISQKKSLGNAENENLKVGDKNPVLNPPVFSMEMDQISAVSNTEKSVEIWQQPRAHAYINNNNIYIYNNFIIKDYINTHAHARDLESKVQPKVNDQSKFESKPQIESEAQKKTAEVNQENPKKDLKSVCAKVDNITYIINCKKQSKTIEKTLKIHHAKKPKNTVAPKKISHVKKPKTTSVPTKIHHVEKNKKITEAPAKTDCQKQPKATETTPKIIQEKKPRIYSCLEPLGYVSDYWKVKFSNEKPEKDVSDGVRYIASLGDNVDDGDIGRIKLLQTFLKNPQMFEHTIKRLDKPTTKVSLKEIINSKLVSGNVYNGYIVEIGEKGICLYPQGGNGFHQVTWTEGKEKVKDLLGKLKMNIDLAA